MTALTARQLLWLHDELGTPPTDEQLQADFDSRGTVRGVAIAEWSRRRTAMIQAPTSTTLVGVAAVSYSENLKAIERRLAALSRMDEDPSDDPVPPGEDGKGPQYVDRVSLTRTRGR